MENTNKYKPIDGAEDIQNLIVGVYCIANEIAILNENVKSGIITYHPA